MGLRERSSEDAVVMLLAVTKGYYVVQAAAGRDIQDAHIGDAHIDSTEQLIDKLTLKKTQRAVTQVR